MKDQVITQVLSTFNANVVKTIELYVDGRIDELFSKLKNCKEPSTIYHLQGQIEELEKFKELYSEAHTHYKRRTEGGR